MITIGLTGGIATGKSTVARLLEQRFGVPVIDADEVARAVVAPGQPALGEIAARFGDSILRPDGSLDRPALGKLVMQDAGAREALNAITHPRIREEILRRIADFAAAGAPKIAVEAALMVETGSYRLYDKLVVVSCRPETQLRRLMSRQSFGEEEARRWLAAQLPLAEKERLADVVIDNDGGPEALPAQISAALARFDAELAAGAGQVGREGGVPGGE